MDNSKSLKKDIVIISVPYCEPQPVVAPALLANCLINAGISAKAIDFNLEFIKQFSGHREYNEFKYFISMGHMMKPRFSNSFYKEILKFTIKFLKDIEKKYAPKHIGLSIFTSDSLDFGLIISYLIRKYLPNVKIIAGGKGLEVRGQSNNFHYDEWANNSIADLVVVGDAETSLIEAINNDHSGLFFSQTQTKEDLDNIPFPNWDDYDIDNYQKISASIIDNNHGNPEEPYLPVTASKGCVRKCSFCDVASFWPKYLYRDPVKVAEEIIYNYKKTGIKHFFFTDNLINGSVTNFRKMNEIIASRIPKQITYEGYAIFRSSHAMPERDFELASKAADQHWSIGVESGSEKIRIDMKKKFSNDDLDWSVQMLHKYNITQNWLIIVGYPTETEEDFNETKNLIKKYSHFSKNKAITVQVTPPFLLLPNSPLLMNPLSARYHGLDHLVNEPPSEKVRDFWISTKNPENDYLNRSRRWKELIQLIRDQGYSFGKGMPIEKWKKQISHLDKKYKETYEEKTISVYTG